jgi:hypothetical protein
VVSGPAWTAERRLQNLLLVECRHFLLGRKCRRLVWCAASGPVCSVWGDSVLDSVRGLGTGVDVGAAAPESLSPGVSSLPARADGSSARVVRALGAGVSCCVALSVVPSCSGGSVVGSQVHGLGAGVWSLGCTVFASFPYKLAVWVRYVP